jgi:hypothetical protein
MADYHFEVRFEDGRTVRWALADTGVFEDSEAKDILSAMRVGLDQDGFVVGPLIKTTETEEIVSDLLESE